MVKLLVLFIIFFPPSEQADSCGLVRVSSCTSLIISALQQKYVEASVAGNISAEMEP